MSEREFLEQIKANQGIIYKVVSLYAADQEEKKDLYQEILLQSWKGWPAFRGESRFSTWLYRISLNTVLTSRRKKEIILFQEAVPEDGQELPLHLNQEDVALLHQAIRQLGETDRAVVLLHLEGYSNTEIADMMGITANALGVKLARVRQRLAKLLKSGGHE